LEARVTRADRARSFLNAGETYERYRPGFPASAVSVFVPSRVGAVLDLGAGTGKLTRLLVASADAVIAVDPSAQMLDQLTLACPTVDVRVGTAEDIPLGDATVDLVTVAQAFHWFDQDRACAEIRRVLHPGGGLALVANMPDASCGWDVACGRIAHPHLEGAVPDQDVPPAQPPLPGFEPVDSAWVRWSEAIAREDYLRRWSTVSAFLVADERRRQEMRSQMVEVLDGDLGSRGQDVLQLPQATEVLVYRREE
jgi:SAM-dependent methyltransferase